MSAFFDFVRCLGYMKDDLKIVIETLHLPDHGETENVMEMNQEDYSKINSQLLDVIVDQCSLRDKALNPATFQSKKTNRGPMDPKV